VPRPRESVDWIEASAYAIPTDFPESDGTLCWNSTTLVLVEARGGGCRGLGFTYANLATATLVRRLLAELVIGRDAMDVAGCWSAMVRAIRNLGRPGIASMAVAAVDVVTWPGGSSGAAGGTAPARNSAIRGSTSSRGPSK